MGNIAKTLADFVNQIKAFIEQIVAYFRGLNEQK